LFARLGSTLRSGSDWLSCPSGPAFDEIGNWKDSQQLDIQGTTIPSSNDSEAAIVRTLVPGNYTAVVRGTSNSTGIALVEVYNLQ